MKIVKEIYKILLNLKNQTHMEDFIANKEASNCMGKNSMLWQHEKRKFALNQEISIHDYLKYTYMHTHVVWE